MSHGACLPFGPLDYMAIALTAKFVYNPIVDLENHISPLIMKSNKVQVKQKKIKRDNRARIIIMSPLCTQRWRNIALPLSAQSVSVCAVSLPFISL